MAGSAPLFPRPRSRRPRPPSPFPYTTLFRSYRGDIATIPANLAGVPGMSLPSGLAEDGLPAGFQVLAPRSEEHTSELQSRFELVCRLLLEENKPIRNTSKLHTCMDTLIKTQD